MVKNRVKKSRKYSIGILVNTKPDTPLSHSIGLLTAEIKKAGHIFQLIYPPAVSIYVKNKTVHFCGTSTPWPPDVVINRHDITTITEHDVQVVREIEAAGVPVVNNMKNTLIVHNKFLANRILMDHGIPVPPMARITNTSNLENITEALGGFPIITKSNKSNQGKGVVKVSSLEELRSLIDFVINNRVPEDIFLQSFIKEAAENCPRVVVIDAKIVTAYGRAVPRGDFRASLRKGAFTGFIKLTNKEIKLFQRIPKIFGLDIMGFDFARTPHGPQIIEVNAYPGIGELYNHTGYNLAPYILQATLRKIPTV